MADLELGAPLPESLFSALGIAQRQGFRPRLIEGVWPVVLVNRESDVLTVSIFADQWTDDRKAFFGTGQQNALAANFSMVQLWNAAGTGKNLYVDVIEFASDSTSAFSLYLDTAAIAAGGGNQSAKWVSGDAPVAAVNVAAAAAPAGTLAYQVRVNGYDGQERVMNPPLKLPPGYGVTVVRADAVNQLCRASFQWRESDV